MPEAIEIQLKKGALELCVLALLSKHDSYAYEVAAYAAGPTEIRIAWPELEGLVRPGGLIRGAS